MKSKYDGIICDKDLAKINFEQYITEDDVDDDMFFGFRILDHDYRGYTAKPGDVLDYSHIWEDGEWTDGSLDGVSALDVWKIAPTSVAAYPGDRVLLIKSREAKGGEDANELVMVDAVVIAVFDFT